jgi:two-component system cell cycle sensor histidine kinase/response regulator CckA
VRPRSIRTLLVALVVAVAIPLVGVQVYDLARGARAARAAARDAGLAVARLVARNVQQMVDRRRAWVKAAAARPRVRALDPARCDPLLADLVQTDPSIANAATFDVRGNMVCSGVPVPSGARVVHPSVRAGALQGAGGIEVMDSPLLGRPVAAIEAPLVGAGGALAGHVRLGLDLGAISDSLDGIDLPRGASLVIVDQLGLVVAATGVARAWQGRPVPDAALRVSRPGPEGFAEARGDGRDDLLVFVDVPGSPWRVSVISPAGAALAEIRAGLLRDGVALVLVLAAVIGLAVLLSRRITLPVVALEHELRLMERGLAGASFPVMLVRPDGAIAYANEAAAHALRCRREDLLATRMFDWDADHPEERWGDAWLGIREGGSIRLQTHLRRRNGTTFPVELHVEHLVFEGEEYAFAFANDLTERAHAEEALRRAQDQVLHAQKMEAVGRLAGGVAHDFNNLLTVILSCAQTLAEALPEGDSRRIDAEEIGRAGRSAAGLTKQLLAFSRKQAVAPRVLRLGELVAATDKMLRRIIGEDVALQVSGVEAPWRVRVDPGTIEQVLLNLAVNARDAMPSGGTVAIEVSRRHLAGPLVDGGASVPPGWWVVLRVSDTGSGMDDHVRRHAFEPFFSTKPQGQGTGLGLATVYGIVRQASGYVALESAPGSGTTFRIYLPEVERDAPLVRATPAPRPPPAMRSAGATLLVVEDDGQLRGIMARALSDAGYRVIAAGSGAEALRAAEGHSGEIDLLLTDVVMPGMNGRELADRIAAARPATPALFLSGYTDDILGPQGVLAPGIQLLQKPFTSAELLAAVGQRLVRAA